MENPKFKQEEVVVIDTYVRGQGLDLGKEANKYITSEVVHVGENATKYKVGDKILAERVRGKELDYFPGVKYLIFHENYIICQIC